MVDYLCKYRLFVGLNLDKPISKMALFLCFNLDNSERYSS
jgi:hypothetical protein